MPSNGIPDLEYTTRTCGALHSVDGARAEKW